MYNTMQAAVFTHQLAYGVRRDLCNLLDADQSWRTLGGQFMGLDATQLTLIGQAYMRNTSPTDELLSKLDTANVRTSKLCEYLERMQHWRAIDILQPYVCMQHIALQQTLDTPTPSFDSDAHCLLPQPLQQQQQQQQQLPISGQIEAQNPFDSDAWPHHNNVINSGKTRQQPRMCHNDIHNNAQQQQQQQHADPGEQIVRLACANNRKRTSISDEEVVNQLRLIMQITYNELKQASDDFADANILGNGGFARVYRGHWKGTDVAIKRLKCNLIDQALNELTILNSYRIDNILPIYGISIDGPEACLVYQFMANGSLEDRLSCKNNSSPLPWTQRSLIGEGVAKGLYYLHTLRDKPLVHGDVKSANVLLDSQFVPKLGDFGLARQVFKGQYPQSEIATHCTVSSIHGTSVYLPPEYLRHKILSPAVDAYSYGIVMLEMATGKRAYDGKRLLIDLIEDAASGHTSLAALKDPRLRSACGDDDEQLKIWFELLVSLGLSCAHKIKKKRLDMGQVLARFAEFNSSSSRTSAAAAAAAAASSPAKAHVARGSRASKPRTPAPASPANVHVNNNNNNRASSVRHDSKLMSVDEGLEVTQTAQAHDANQTQQAQQQVDAMIPLLTELGLQAG